MRDHVGNMRKA